jgi:transketolase
MFANRMRRMVLDQAYRAKVGHIGSALSVVDLLAALYEEVLSIDHPDAKDRDRFVLAKGHSALALYAALTLKGWISEAQLNSYCTDGTLLGVHPDQRLTGVDFATGSLGQGLPYGVGAALAARLDSSPRRVFVLMSDAEANEGAVWEAVMFAAHQRLSQLVVLVDVNGQQGLGHTKDVLDLSPLSNRWDAFGWEAIDIDGHAPDKIAACLRGLNYTSGPPHALLAQTTAGKGVSFMEHQVAWHYLPMSAEQYQQAIQEIQA